MTDIRDLMKKYNATFPSPHEMRKRKEEEKEKVVGK